MNIVVRRDIFGGCTFSSLVRCTGIVTVILIPPLRAQTAIPTATAATLSRKPASLDRVHNQEFLKVLTQEVPALAAECVMRDWHIPRPPKAEAGHLRREHWGFGNGLVPSMLDSVRQWWAAQPVQYRAWMVCEGRFRERLFASLRPVITAGQMLSVIEPLLVALADTSQVTEAQYVAARVRSDSLAAKVVALATSIGDPHRYDAAIATYIDRDEFRYYRGEALSLLARVYLTQGRLREAQQAALKASALIRQGQDPMLLTEIALRQNDTVTALHELAFCRIGLYFCTSTPARDSTTAGQLAMLYRAVNHGVLTGLDTVLKQALRDSRLQFPVPITAWRSSHTSKSYTVQRTTLLQYITWVHCGNCARHDLAANALTQRFGDQLIVLAYHYVQPLSFPGWQNMDGQEFGKMIHRVFNVGTANITDRDTTRDCDWWIDGACMHVPFLTGFWQWGALSAYDWAAPVIAQHVSMSPLIKLSLHVVRADDRIMTRIGVAGLSSDNPVPHVSSSRRLKLHVVLVEDSIFIAGGNSPIQNHVVRAVAGDSATGFGRLLPKDYRGFVAQDTFNLSALERIYLRKAQARHAQDGDPSSWNARVFHIDRGQLSVVVYVQDQTTGEVLQAVQAPVL